MNNNKHSSSFNRSKFRRQALYGFADATGYERYGALYAEFDPTLIGDVRYQFELLAIGNQKFASLAPIRGTLNEEKLDYFTWRLHHLFVDQLDRERLEGNENVSQTEDDAEVEAGPDQQRSQSNSSSISSNSIHSSRDGSSSSTNSKSLPMATAMERMADLSISEPGWVTMQNYRQMAQEEKRTSYRHAIVTSDALAAVPLLEREERHFVIAEEGEGKNANMNDGESDECDSLFDHFYDAKVQQQPTIDIHDEDERDQFNDHKSLPPPLLPASMFYRASFGIRQKPNRKISNKSVVTLSSEPDTMSKLRTLFKAPLLKRADSEDARTSVYVK